MSESNKYPWSDAELKQWQAAGDVFVISGTFKEVEHHVAIKAPDWPVLRNVSAFVNKDDEAAAGELIIENCWLGGSPDVRSNPFIKMGVCMAAVSLISRSVPRFEGKPLGKP